MKKITLKMIVTVFFVGSLVLNLYSKGNDSYKILGIIAFVAYMICMQLIYPVQKNHFLLKFKGSKK